eukprot:2780091-Prymnesium_polylepis.1
MRIAAHNVPRDVLPQTSTPSMPGTRMAQCPKASQMTCVFARDRERPVFSPMTATVLSDTTVRSHTRPLRLALKGGVAFQQAVENAGHGRAEARDEGFGAVAAVGHGGVMEDDADIFGLLRR